MTATKRSQSIHDVPLSIVALSQRSLQERDLRSIQDIARAAPGLTVTGSNTANGAQISVRGISSTLGASTTAIYLDDVPLQKRTVAGDATGSGSPFPQVFDLQRVEVLRGPQGTLFGQGAEGGAVRFITPTPSLTRYSGDLHGEVAGTASGGIDNEQGIALGGPLLRNILGFRVSYWDRHDSGYIDHVDANTGDTLATDTNTRDRWALRAALLWKPTDNFSANLAYYMTRDHNGDSDQFSENIPAITVPGGANLATHTYGPYNGYGFGKTIENCNIGQDYAGVIPACYQKQPRTTTLNVPSLSLDYGFDAFSLHSTTAYAVDDTKGLSDAALGDPGSFQGGFPFVYNLPAYAGNLIYDDRRRSFTEEARATSRPSAGPWSWVGGFFYSNQHTYQTSQDYSTGVDALMHDLFGASTTDILGAPVGPDGGISLRRQTIVEKEYAGFGELNYSPIKPLKLTVGLRTAADQIEYHGYLQGAFFGVDVPTATDGGLNSGSQSNTAVLPKFSVQYILNPDVNFYSTAAKGNRVGGVNTAPYFSKCSPTFKSLGVDGTPSTYKPDSLWSYEVGTKLRAPSSKIELNASLFYIDWSRVQTTYTLPGPCYFAYVANAGGAVSKGGDIDARAELFPGFVASVDFAYTDAHYTDAVTQGQSVFINKGDRLPVPSKTLDVGARYGFSLLDRYDAYVRGDYQYQGSYRRGFGPGTATYDADTYRASDANFITLRTGVRIRTIELSLFVDNLMNSRDILSREGGRSCANASCTSTTADNPVFLDTTFRPRSVGLTLESRF